MKRNFKRLFALVMTLALAISCATGAFAAEPQDELFKIASQDDVSSLDDFATPRAIYYVTIHNENMQNGSSFSDHFSLSRPGKLVAQLTATGRCHIVVQVGYSSTHFDTLIDEYINAGGGQVWKISNDTFPTGMEVKVTVTFEADNVDYALLMWTE